MSFAIDDVEWLWILVNGGTLVLTLLALREARRDQATVRALNGKAREIAADGAVQSELFRIAIAVCLLLPIIPGLFSDHDLSLVTDRFPYLSGVVWLVIAAALLLLWSLKDTRERRILLAQVARETRS